MTNHELLLEIGTEELPAGFIGPALESLSELVVRTLKTAGIGHGARETFATPRRLILRIENVEPLQA